MKYSSEHVWLEIDDAGVGRVGISDHAQSELGDIVYLELPPVGQHIASGDAVGVIESVKTNSDLYAPANGTVTEHNTAALESPELVNQSPLFDGWLFCMQLDDESELDSLLDESDYLESVELAD